MGQLLEGEHASRGSAQAPLTLVIFSDFQCPFCRRMKAMLAAEPLVQSGSDVRLVFRHMPLAQHDWAEQAAEAAACAQFQNESAFWQMYDALFDNQDKITKATFSEELNRLASKVSGLDMAQFRTCVERQMTLGTVVRDRHIGIKAGVDATPTLFLNGMRLPGISNGPELHQILSEALARARAEQAHAGLSAGRSEDAASSKR